MLMAYVLHSVKCLCGKGKGVRNKTTTKEMLNSAEHGIEHEISMFWVSRNQ